MSLCISLFQAYADLRHHQGMYRKYIFFPDDTVSRRKLGVKTKNSSSRPQSSRPFNQHAPEGQLQILMRPLIFN